MEFLDDMKQLQLVALVGRDKDEKQTVISICAVGDDIKKAARVIFESWPDTRTIDRFTLTLSSQPTYSINRAELEHMPIE